MAELIWQVGGAQGEGIDSTGDILANTLNRLGHYLFAYRSFMSLIKGGHTSYKIRVADRPAYHHGDGLDILIAFDQATVAADAGQLGPDGLVIYDEGRFQPRLPDGAKVEPVPVPMSDFAQEIGGNILMKNMVAVGVSAAILGLAPDPFYRQIEERFGRKGKETVATNLALIRRGYEHCRERYPRLRRELPEPAEGANYLLSGNEAVALGALLGGCRFLAAYPITPATEIMYWLLANLPRYGGKVVQAEDEIAACQMAIGAALRGARAMTSTSGPGYSLMAESLGLASMGEVPLVVVDVQRGGPATGLPTRTEQSDLAALLNNSHGEGPRIVVAPGTIEEAVYLTAEAFNLAECYQCPVIIASDLYLGMSQQSLRRLDLGRIRIDRGRLQTDAELAMVPGGAFERYEDAPEDGISPRSVPGQKGGEYCLLGNEHDEAGRLEIEDPSVRAQQMEKRFRKLERLAAAVAEWGWIYEGPEAPELLLVGWGSTRGPIAEAAAWLRGGPAVLDGKAAGGAVIDGGTATDSVVTGGAMAGGGTGAVAGGGTGAPRVGHLHLRALRPFPAEAVSRHLARCQSALVVENNFTGQLANLIRQECGYHDRLYPCHRYDGNPFTVAEIVAVGRKLLKTPVPAGGGLR